MHYTGFLLKSRREKIAAGTAKSLTKMLEAIKETHKENPEARVFLILERVGPKSCPHAYMSGATLDGLTGYPAFTITTSSSSVIPINIWEDPEFWESHAGLLGEPNTQGKNPCRQRWPTLQRHALRELGAETSVGNDGVYTVTAFGKTGTGTNMQEAFENLIRQ